MSEQYLRLMINPSGKIVKMIKSSVIKLSQEKKCSKMFNTQYFSTFVFTCEAGKIFETLLRPLVGISGGLKYLGCANSENKGNT